MSDDIDAHVLRRFELCQKLGKGAYGVVFKAIEKVRLLARQGPSELSCGGVGTWVDYRLAVRLENSFTVQLY